MNWFHRTAGLDTAYWVVVILVALMACSSSPTPTSGKAESAPPIESESPEVQQAFEEAVQLLRDGQWERAREGFRLLQAQFSEDETAALAELYIARTHLGDLDTQFEATPTEQGTSIDPEAFALLEPLAISDGVDDRIRFAAQSYLSTAHALGGESKQAVQILESYPGPSLSPALLEDDRRWIWPLVAEGLAASGRAGDSVAAWGSLHSLLREELQVTGEQLGDTDSAGSPEWFADVDLPPKADLAVARAFEAEDQLGDDDLRRFLSNEHSLARAVGAWTLIRRELDEPLEQEDVETLQALFNDVSPDFLAVGAADRLSELSVALRAVSGPERLVIGALLPLSGPNRSVGYRALAGMLIAQRAFHAAGEPTITLVIEDSFGAVSDAYRRLVEEGVLAIVGPLHTEQARELIDPAAEYGVPVLALAADRITPIEVDVDDDLEETVEVSTSTANDEVSTAESSPVAPVFRNFVDSVAEARAAARISFEALGDRRAAVVYPDMGYGRTLAQAFVEEFRHQGGEVVIEANYDRQASDFVALARRVARSNPDAIFLPDTGSKVAEITAFFAQEQVWGLQPGASPPDENRIYVHYLGTSLWQDPLVLHQAASYVDGAVVPAWYSPHFEDAETRQFTGGFEAIYDTGADHFVAFAYDSVARLRTYLLERGLPDATAISDALRQPQWELGITGRNYFGEDGEPHRELRYLTVVDGAWEVYDKTVITPLDGRHRVEVEMGADDLESIDNAQADERESYDADELR